MGLGENSVTGAEVSHVTPFILAVHDPDSEHELLRVVIIKDAIEVISKAGIDLLRDLLHG